MGSNAATIGFALSDFVEHALRAGKRHGGGLGDTFRSCINSNMSRTCDKRHSISGGIPTDCGMAS